jgi:hypothetical protein
MKGLTGFPRNTSGDLGWGQSRIRAALPFPER